MFGVCSNSLVCFIERGVAQTGSAFGSGPKGRGFKSLRPDHFSPYNAGFCQPAFFFFRLWAIWRDEDILSKCHAFDQHPSICNSRCRLHALFLGRESKPAV